MKKILSTIAISALISTSSMAVEFVQGGVYGGFGVGYEDYSGYSYIDTDPGMTVVINGGKPIVKLGPGVLGAEGEFTYTAIPLSYDFCPSCDLNIMTLGAYATYTYDFSNKFYARAKAGIVHRNYDYENSSIDTTTTGEALGMGVGMKLNQHMKLYTDIISLDGFDLTQINLGVQVGF